MIGFEVTQAQSYIKLEVQGEAVGKLLNLSSDEGGAFMEVIAIDAFSIFHG